MVVRLEPLSPNFWDHSPNTLMQDDSGRPTQS
jgi:hypothetical protein